MDDLEKRGLFIAGILLLLVFVRVVPVYSVTTLVVRVLNVDGEPVSGALVTLVSPPPGAYVIANNRTDEEGFVRFYLESPPDEVTLIVSLRDEIVYNERISPYQGAVSIKVDVADIRVETLSTSNNPLAGLRVQLSWPSITGIKKISGFTDKDGRVIFKNMPLIEYNLSVYKDNELLYESTFDADFKRDLKVYLKLYYVSIQVVDNVGNPLKNVFIRLYGEGIVKQKFTNLDGYVKFTFIPKGSYNLDIQYFGYEDTKRIDVYSDKEIKYVLSGLSRFLLRVKVIDDSGNPMSFIKVEVRSSRGVLAATGYTNEAGLYIVELYTGDYLVTAYYDQLSKSVDVRLDEDKIIRIIFRGISTGSGKSTEVFPNIFEIISKNIILLIFIIIFVIFVIIIVFHYMFISKQAV